MKTLTIMADAWLKLPEGVLRHLNAGSGDQLLIVASPVGELRLRRTPSTENAPAPGRVVLCSISWKVGHGR
ncbi:hypothetical protein Q4F19_13745 [Sphingomonas sp. BIUV-7]|uniref:AbrB/MazE/SpoVT family DNA-binding domain-containing protein n=1 Tax=Sphingomonas natans TaxID=3063330 RepID=A0ABT8YAU3_9SPHN|nr:hypothetical protein [Sphingomonas sp. BIUV-7]MDO6415451.1 hypothetical protein [Sphingomonas sp. BIUV-7]